MSAASSSGSGACWPSQGPRHHSGVQPDRPHGAHFAAAGSAGSSAADIITRDNVTLKVNAVIFLRVIDPNKAVWKSPITSIRLRSSRRLPCARCSAKQELERIAGAPRQD